MKRIHQPDNREALSPVEPRPFKPESLVELARHGIQPPEFVVRELFYKAAVHSVTGPPESGKTTLVVWVVLGLLQRGERVVYVDEESGREQLVEKLLAMGAEPEELEGLAYLEFESRRWDRSDVAGFLELLEEHKPALVVFDSMAAILANAGKDENKAQDVRELAQSVMLEPARRFGSAVVYVDHVAKADDGGRYSRGSGTSWPWRMWHGRRSPATPSTDMSPDGSPSPTRRIAGVGSIEPIG